MPRARRAVLWCMSQAALSFRKMQEDTVELAVSPNPAAHQDSLVRTISIFGENPTAANNSITTTLYSWWSFPTVRRAPVRGSHARTAHAHGPRPSLGPCGAAHTPPGPCVAFGRLV